MLFSEIFDKLQRNNPEIEMIGIWGADGLELEKKVFVTVPSTNIDLLGAEMADVFLRLQKVADIDKSYFLEMIFQGSRKLYIFSIDFRYYLLVMAKKDLLANKLKFHIEVCRDKLLAML